MSSFEETQTPNRTILSTPKWTSSRRTHSLSSTSLSSNSSSSYRSFFNEDSQPPSPPQKIPFSWETIPGISKHHIIKRIESSRNSTYLLPLPPAASTNASKPICKKNHVASRNDPFFAALVECSKRDIEEDEEEKVLVGSISRGPVKSLSHRFGFVNVSCKNTCSVAESMVFLPREQPRRISYGLVKKRSR